MKTIKNVLIAGTIFFALMTLCALFIDHIENTSLRVFVGLFGITNFLGTIFIITYLIVRFWDNKSKK